MFCRHVFGNISGGFRGISCFLGNFAGFRGNTGISRARNRVKYQKPCIKSSETLASFKNQVRRVDVENLLRPVTCATLRIVGWAGFLSLCVCFSGQLSSYYQGQKNLEHFQFWGMHIQFPCPHAVLLKSAVLEA